MVNCDKCGEELKVFKNPEEMMDEEFYCEDCKKPSPSTENSEEDKQ